MLGHQPMNSLRTIKSALTYLQTATNRRGFSLVELLACLGVGGILMVIAIPAFTRTLPGLRLNDAARQIATELHQIRMKTIAQNAPHQMLFTATTYLIERCKGGCTADGGTKTLPTGITVTPPTVTPQFNSRGGVTAGLVDIRLTNGSANRWVCVSVIGRIKVQESVCT